MQGRSDIDQDFGAIDRSSPWLRIPSGQSHLGIRNPLVSIPTTKLKTLGKARIENAGFDMKQHGAHKPTSHQDLFWFLCPRISIHGRIHGQCVSVYPDHLTADVSITIWLRIATCLSLNPLAESLSHCFAMARTRTLAGK
jgi:hypothetical protein